MASPRACERLVRCWSIHAENRSAAVSPVMSSIQTVAAAVSST